MLFEKAMGKLFTLCEWVMKLAYLNILWFLFSLAGLLVLGMMPATIALFSIIRKWQWKETDFPIWRTFLSIYREEFKKSNRLGWCLIASGVFITFDFLLIRTVHGTLQLALIVPLIMITVFYIITLLYIFPVYVHYDLKMIAYIKNAFFLGILNFHITLIMLAGLAALSYLILLQPGFIPFFSIVSFAWVLMVGGNYCFNRIEARKRKVRNSYI